jgi:hypothetical protein
VAVLLNVNFLRRQAARERKAAKSAITDAAKERHLQSATRYTVLAEQIQNVEERESARPALSLDKKADRPGDLPGLQQSAKGSQTSRAIRQPRLACETRSRG